MKPDNEKNHEEKLAKGWYDSHDVLLRLHISSSTLERWRRRKILPYARIGRKIYYRESDLIALLEKNLQKSRV